MNSRSQSFFVYFLLLVAIGAMLYMGFNQNANAAEPLTISTVAQQVQNGEIARIIISGDDTIRVVGVNGTEEDAVESRIESGTTFVEQLLSFGVTTEQLDKVDVEVSAPSPWGGSVERCSLSSADSFYGWFAVVYFPSGTGQQQRRYVLREEPRAYV